MLPVRVPYRPRADATNRARCETTLPGGLRNCSPAAWVSGAQIQVAASRRADHKTILWDPSTLESLVTLPRRHLVALATTRAWLRTSGLQSTTEFGSAR